MSRKLVLFLTLLLWSMMALPLPTKASAETALTRAIIQQLRNIVRLIPKNNAGRPARISEAMSPGDALATGRASLAELRFNDGSLARVGEQALFQFVPNTRDFRLGNGTALLLIPPGRGTTRVRTPNAAAGIRGSALFVRYIPESDTTVVGALTNSNIEVFNRGASQSQPLQAGQMAVIVKDKIERVFNFDLRTFYETSDLVKGLNLTQSGTQTSSDSAIAQVQAETSAAVAEQTPINGGGTIENPAFVQLPANPSSAPNLATLDGISNTPLPASNINLSPQNFGIGNDRANPFNSPGELRTPLDVVPPIEGGEVLREQQNRPDPPPEQGGTPPGQGGTPPGQGGTPPGQGGTPPGQGGTPPGQGGTPPGQGGTPPGQGGTPPGQDGTPPGQGGTPPGQGGTPPGQGGTPPGQGGTPPGQGGTPPGQDGTPPGQGGTPPGQDGTPPGQGGTPPGQGGTPPGQGGTPPGQGGTPPGQGGTPPGQGGTPPGQGGTPPGQGGTPPPGSVGQTPGQSGETPGQGSTPPGQSGQTPGQSGETPGQGSTPPGQSGQTPGQSGETPGQSGETPGQGSTPPGQSGQTPGQSGETPGQGSTPPGQSGQTPGQSGETPGQGSTPPGQSGQTPGQSGETPGQSGETPGQGSTPPGQSGQTPGQSGNAPGQSGNTPGQSGTTPGQSGQTPGQGGTLPPGQSGNTPGQSGNNPGQSGTALRQEGTTALPPATTLAPIEPMTLSPGQEVSQPVRIQPAMPLSAPQSINGLPGREPPMTTSPPFLPPITQPMPIEPIRQFPGAPNGSEPLRIQPVAPPPGS